MEDGNAVVKERLGDLSSISPDDLCMCLLSNQTRCECTASFQTGSMKVMVYNPYSSSRNEAIQVPINVSDGVKVRILLY